MVAELLGRCPGVRVLATSREGLGISGELLVPVDALSSDAAVALFVERMAGFDSTGRRAAGREHLRSARPAPARHRARGRPRPASPAGRAARPARRSVRRARWRCAGVAAESAGSARGRGLELPAARGPERDAFECLSVFADGATLDGAASVVRGAGLVPRDVERLLGRLVDKSLIYVDRTGATTRYRMLQTLYDFSLDRLTASGAEAVVRRAHAEWVAEPGGDGRLRRSDDRRNRRRRYRTRRWRCATRWRGRDAADPLLALDIVTALAPFWFGSMRVSAGWELLICGAGCRERGRRSASRVPASLGGTVRHDGLRRPTAARFDRGSVGDRVASSEIRTGSGCSR